jgi:NADH:ubiquinone oxidoreductase subunit 6 (subunit J)
MAGELLTLGIIGIILFVVLMLALVGVIIWLFIFWIMMVVDAATRKFKSDADKIIWVLIIIFLQILGAIIYYFVIKKNSK